MPVFAILFLLPALVIVRLLAFAWSLFYIRKRHQLLWAVTTITWGIYLAWRGLGELPADRTTGAVALVASVLVLVSGFESWSKAGEEVIKEREKFQFRTASQAALHGGRLIFGEMFSMLNVFFVAMLVAIGFSIWLFV